MRFLKLFISRVERDTGIPGRFILPVLVASLSLTVAPAFPFSGAAGPMTSDAEPAAKPPAHPRRLAHA